MAVGKNEEYPMQVFISLQPEDLNGAKQSAEVSETSFTISNEYKVAADSETPLTRKTHSAMKALTAPTPTPTEPYHLNLSDREIVNPLSMMPQRTPLPNLSCPRNLSQSEQTKFFNIYKDSKKVYTHIYEKCGCDCFKGIYPIFLDLKLSDRLIDTVLEHWDKQKINNEDMVDRGKWANLLAWVAYKKGMLDKYSSGKLLSIALNALRSKGNINDDDLLKFNKKPFRG